MKKIIVIIAAVLAVWVAACTDEDIGSSLSDSRTEVVADSTSFSMSGHSVLSPRLQSRTVTQLIGRLSDGDYGSLSSEVVAQLMPTLAIDTLRVTASQIDSCKLLLRVPATGGFTGDSLVPMRMSVYRLNKQLPSPIYSDFDPKDYYDPSDLLGEAAYNAPSSTRATDSQTGVIYLEVAVPMPVELARELFALYKADEKTFATPKAFAAKFPGLYISNSYGTGRVMSFYDTRLVSYYHRTVKTAAGADSIVRATQTYAAVTPEVVVNNVLRLDVAQTLDDAVAAGQAIVAAPAGYELHVSFPIQLIVDAYKESLGKSVGAFNTLEMTIPVEEIKNENGIKPPSHLLFVKSYLRDKFIAGDSLTNDKDSFLAEYDASKKCYVFDDMRNYLLDIIKEKGSYADDEDMEFVIMPVDVTKYTQSASYTSSAYETITKIAPSVAKPSMARLRIDKAKIKVVYNKQVVL